MADNGTTCRGIILGENDLDFEPGIEQNLELWYSYVVFALTGIFVALLAFVFNFIRDRVFNDKDNLDTSFDAGGKVSMGLTATTIVSQWTWAATLLQSSTVASKVSSKSIRKLISSRDKSAQYVSADMRC